MTEVLLETVESRIRKSIATALSREIKPDAIKGTDLIGELGISSVDALEILIRIESEFNIIIDDSDLSQKLLTSINTLSDYVQQKLDA